MPNLILNGLSNEQVRDVLDKALNGTLNGKKSVVIVSDDLLEQPEPTAESDQERRIPDFVLRNTLRECERQNAALMATLNREQEISSKLREDYQGAIQEIHRLRDQMDQAAGFAIRSKEKGGSDGRV